jgi:hypothetical protein
LGIASVNENTDLLNTINPSSGALNTLVCQVRIGRMLFYIAAASTVFRMRMVTKNAMNSEKR